MSHVGGGDRGGAAAVPADPDDLARVHPRRAAARDLDRRGRRRAPFGRHRRHGRHARGDVPRDLLRAAVLPADLRAPDHASRAARTSCTPRSSTRARCTRDRRSRLRAIRRSPDHGRSTMPKRPAHRHRRSRGGARRLRRHPAGAAAARPARRRPRRAAQNALLERWWTAFDDPVLTALIDEALANNLDLRGDARAHRSRARAGAARAVEPVPSVNLRAGASRSRESQSTASPPLPLRLGAEQRLQRRRSRCPTSSTSGASTAAARSPPRNDLAASRYYRETVRITVAADVANAYFRLRAADALLVVLEDTRKPRTDTVDAAARSLRRRPHRRVRPAPGGGGALRGRRRHRARAAGDRPHSRPRSRR